MLFQKKKPLVTPLSKAQLVLIFSIILVLLLTGFVYTLSDKSQQKPTTSELVTSPEQQTNQLTPESEETLTPRFSSTENEVEKAAETETPGEDFYVGPVKLPNSAFIVEKLDQAALEVENQAAPQVAATDADIALSDFFAHPIDSFVQVSSSVKAAMLNNGRRTTLIKLVDSVSRYFVAYQKFPFPERPLADEEYEWVREMVEKREMSGVYDYVLKTTAPVSYCGAVNQTGYCYKTDGQNAVIYVRLEKPSGGELCGEDGVFFLWSSEDNKLGSVCLFEEPTRLGGFSYVRY